MKSFNYNISPEVIWKKILLPHTYLLFTFLYVLSTLLIFTPFGISGRRWGFILLITGYAFSGVLIIIGGRKFIIPFLLSHANRKLKEILEIVIELILLILGIFLYAKFTFYTFNGFHGYVIPNPSFSAMATKVLLLMIVPFTFLLLMRYARPEHHFQTGKVVLKSTNLKEWLSVDPKIIVFIKAEGNYITVNYLQDNHTKVKLLRKTLKVTMFELREFSFIQQIHKSYLINCYHLSTIQKEKGKNYLILNSHHKIPVSKKHRALLDKECFITQK